MTIKGRVTIGVCSVIFFVLLVFLKVTISARSEYQRGERALQNNDLTQAILHFDRAIHWYSPKNRAVHNSMQALWRIGAQSEDKGDHEIALQAYRALRSSLYSARSFYTPHPDWIARCDDKIASILEQKQTASTLNGKVSPKTSKEEILKILSTRTEPDVFWSVLLEIGLLGWVGGSVAFILRAFSGQKGLSVRQALGWGLFVIIFYGLWIVGMLKA